MGDIDSGPRKVNELSFPTPVGSHGDGKNVSSTALLAKLKTPGVGKNEEELDPKSGVGFPGSLDEVAPQEQTNARQLGSTPGVGKNEEELDPKSGVGFPGSLDKVAPQRDIVAVQDGETEIAIGFGNDGDGDRAISQDLAAAQRRPPEPHALQLRSERSLVVNPQVPLSTPEANTDKQGLLVLEPTTQSSELALKPPARSSELVGFSADAYSLVQFSNSIKMLEALHHQNRKMDRMTEDMGVMVKTVTVMAEKMDKLQTKQPDDDDKIGLGAKVEQLSKRLNSAENHLRSLREERGDEKRANEDLQAQARQLSKENERLEQTVKAKVCNIEELEAQVIQLSNSLKDIQEDKRQKQETLADKSAREEELHERVRQLEKEVRQLEKELEVAKQYVQKNPAEYPLDPFTGYAIVASNAIMLKYEKSIKGVEELVKDDDGQVVVDKDRTNAVLDITKGLAEALIDYGFEVKPMRNPTGMEFLEAIEDCDQRVEEPGLVFIFLATHGDSTGFWMTNWHPTEDDLAYRLPERIESRKPTIMCMVACRHHVEGNKASQVECLQQEHVFLVNACRLGCKYNLADLSKFIDGLKEIFTNGDEKRDFGRAITDLCEDTCKGIDPCNHLRKSLILPRFPAKETTPEERKKAKKLVEDEFQHDSKPAQTTTAATS